MKYLVNKYVALTYTKTGTSSIIALIIPKPKYSTNANQIERNKGNIEDENINLYLLINFFSLTLIIYNEVIVAINTIAYVRILIKPDIAATKPKPVKKDKNNKTNSITPVIDMCTIPRT